MTGFRLLALALLAPALLALASISSAAFAGDTLETSVKASVESILDALERDDDVDAATMAFEQLADTVAFYGNSRRPDVFYDVELARRMVGQLGACDGELRKHMLPWLRANEDLAAAVAFLVKERDEPAQVYALLDRLHEKHKDAVTRRPNLTAAIVVVHDVPLTQRVNENTGVAPKPDELLHYFLANEEHLLYGLERLSPELLIYVVDAAASIRELQWAMRRYRGDRQVGARFHDIEYDIDHFRLGQPKRVTAAGWNLPNILEHGGICADQTYFAQTVGKAIGVPTTYTRGKAGEGSHAWVGFLEANRRQAWWNFDIGRYDAFQGVRGVVVDPQTRGLVSDSEIAVLATALGIDARDRYRAEAMCSAAARLVELDGLGDAPPPPVEGAAKQRSADIESALVLLEAGLRLNPGHGDGWAVLASLASDGRLTAADKKRWSGVLHRLCGRTAPDFSLRILAPMIWSVEDLDERHAFWDAAFAQYSHRADLAAWIRFEQGEMWLEAGEPEKAGTCFEDVINRYANAGPFVIDAVGHAEKVLRQKGDGRRLLMLYEKTWQRTDRPQPSAFVYQTNWFKIGKLFAERLEEAGRSAAAARARGELEGLAVSRRR